MKRALPMAASLVAGSMLVRADSGFDSLKLFREITAQANALGREIAFIIKMDAAQSAGGGDCCHQGGAHTGTQWVIHRPGKRECIWQEALELADVGSQANPARRVYRLTERTIDKHAVVLLLPEYVLEGWTTTLPQRLEALEIIALYCDHATHEQFHSEFKTDMDLQRLPSGKFDTNYLVCQLAAVAIEPVAPDWPEHAARTRCTGAPRCQAQAHQGR